MFEIGQKAPDFTLTSDEGSEISLSDYRGKRVLVFFYPKAFTGGCATQACGLRDAFPQIEAGNGVVLGISPDEPGRLAEWREAENLPYNLLSDPDHQVAEAYFSWGERSMYGNKFMGIIRSHFVVDADGNFEDVQHKVSPKKSIEKALKSFK